MVGNKIDKVQLNETARKIKKEEAQEFADKEGIYFEEVSALTDTNVRITFENLLNQVLEVKKKQEVDENGGQATEAVRYKKLQPDVGGTGGSMHKKKGGCC